MCVSIAVNLLSQKCFQYLRSPSQHTLHQIYHHVMMLCGWTVDLPQTSTGFVKSLLILWDEIQLIWNKKCRIFFFFFLLFFFMGRWKVLVRKIQYCFTICFVESANHSCLVWRYCSIQFMPMLPHTPTCSVSSTNCCIGDVSSVAFILLARGFCLFYSRVELSIVLETIAHICAVNWSVWVGHNRTLPQHWQRPFLYSTFLLCIPQKCGMF